MPACKALQAKYPSLVGKKVVVGLGGCTKGFEAPSADDPSVIEGLDLPVRPHRRLPRLHARVSERLLQRAAHLDLEGARRYRPDALRHRGALKQIAFVASVQVQDGSVVKKGNPKALTSLDSLCGAMAAAAAGTYEATKLVPEQTEACTKAGKLAVEMLTVQNTDNSIQAPAERPGRHLPHRGRPGARDRQGRPEPGERLHRRPADYGRLSHRQGQHGDARRVPCSTR